MWPWSWSDANTATQAWHEAESTSQKMISQLDSDSKRESQRSA
ncbi:hypothetical protein LX86_009230 [Lentzea aerocolonigenes]|nr:hypothetical protein [Lentzea aerocolonigenes]